MPTITIRENGRTESGFTAFLEFDHSARFPVTVRDPFGAGEEKRLEWYFEDWLECALLRDDAEKH